MAILVDDNNVGRLVQKVVPLAGLTDTSGDTTILDAPGEGKRIVVKCFSVQNESDQPTVVLMKEGGTVRRRALLQNQGDGYGREFSAGYEWRLPENTALIINLSDGNATNYNLDYFVEAV